MGRDARNKKNFISSVVIFRELNVGHHCNRVFKIDVVCIVHDFYAFYVRIFKVSVAAGFIWRLTVCRSNRNRGNVGSCVPAIVIAPQGGDSVER